MGRVIAFYLLSIKPKYYRIIIILTQSSLTTLTLFSFFFSQSSRLSRPCSTGCKLTVKCFSTLSLPFGTQEVDAQVAVSCSTALYTLTSRCEDDSMWGV